MPRLKERYNNTSAPICKRPRLNNVMQVPKIEKIVVNMGVGRATQQPSLLENAVDDLTLITGQKPVVTKAKKSIAGFKLREGQSIGTKVTLRGDRMWEFFDRLVGIAIPRIRDFRGLPATVMGRSRQLHLRPQRPDRVPRDRVRQDRPAPRHGHHHRDHSFGRCERQGAARLVRVPVQQRRRGRRHPAQAPWWSPPRRQEVGERINGEESTHQQGQREAQVQGAGLLALPALRPRRARCSASSDSAACASASWHTRVRSPV